MLFANWFGQGLINILILTALAGWVYSKWFPKGEPGTIVKEGFIKWLTRRMFK
jgi:hypothetical protein